MKQVPFLITFVIAGFVLVDLCRAQSVRKIIWQSSDYAFFADSLVQQNKYVAKAISRTEVVSNYQSPTQQFKATRLTFKFSINGKDNEMKSGIDHHFNCREAIGQTPWIKFGEPLKDTTTQQKETFLKRDTRLTLRLDMRAVLADFKTKGYYTTFNGDKIFKEDFKGVYVAGGTAPMIWDFDNLSHHPELELKDVDGDGIYETTLILNGHVDEKKTAARWKLSRDISSFPQYSSDYPMMDALYAMALEEMINAVEPDSTFRTGKEWAGVWTRDISYSIILSMAYLQPRVALYSLLKKVNPQGRIIQDTGTGGAYPVSTDRMIWAVAAWELYKVTGDGPWLQKAYRIIKNSVDDDLHNAYDAETGLVHGESSFLDWREQTYPKWMQPADIFESENLGTNAVHYQANIVLSQMAHLLNDEQASTKYRSIAEKIKAGINQYLWMDDRGYYAQYRYGRTFKMRSPRSEALGEALAVLFDVANANQKVSVIAKTPVTAFGISCIYPQIPNIPPYHNNAVWPFVQSYWALASAKTGNEKSVIESISAIDRAAALFVTNKENFVADDGDFAGTQINSSNMLWSLAGSISTIHKVLFGIEFQTDVLAFHPFVPKSLAGTRTLTHFRYRNAVLNITLEGYGHTIQSFVVDNKKQKTPEIPSTLTGNHAVRILLANDVLPENRITKVANHASPADPTLTYSSNKIHWVNIENAKHYTVLKDGNSFLETNETEARVPGDMYAEYQVIAIDEKGLTSFTSEPLMVANEKSIQLYEIENTMSAADLPYKGFSGSGFVEISKTMNRKVSIPVLIDEPGIYSIDFRYANGNGPTNTSNKCAIRTLKNGDTFLATVVLPQRGNDEWSNWGYTNAVKTHLEKGKYDIVLTFDPANENMNGEVNQAMLDYMRVRKVD